MTKLYSVDIPVYATMYVKAETPEQALEIARSKSDAWIMTHEPSEFDLTVDTSNYEDIEDDVTISPAMTIQDLKDVTLHVELCHDYEDASND